MTPARELRLAVGLCAVGAALLLAGQALGWVTVTIPGALTIDDLSRSVTGHDVAPGLRGLGLLGLAAAVAILATRSLGRLSVGLLLVVFGAFSVLQAAQYVERIRLLRVAADHAQVCFVRCPAAVEPARFDVHPLGVWLGVVGGAVLVLAGVLSAVRGRSWSRMGSSYEAPGGAPPAPVTDKGVWDALDRGDDPTS